MSRPPRPPSFEGETTPERSLQRTLALQEKTLGREHPHVLSTLRSLALLYLSQQRISDALPLLERALTASEQHLRQECIASLDARLVHALPELQEEAERLYSLAVAWPKQARVQQLALAAALLRKSLSPESLTQLARSIFRGVRQEDLPLFELLHSLRTGISLLRSTGPGEKPPQEYRQSLEALSSQSDALEEDLASRSSPLSWLRRQPAPPALPQQLAEVLPPDGALVEFVLFRNRPLTYEPEPADWQPTAPARYLALLLFADGRTHSVDLGPAKPLDTTAILLHRALTSRSGSCQPAARALHASAFLPLLPLLKDMRRLFIAPDGWLALVPFAELHDETRFLSDSFDITQLTSGRDLLPGPQGVPRKNSALFLTNLGLDSTPSV